KAFAGGALWGVALPVLLASLLVARRAPLGAAIGLTGVAGLLWGTAAGREQAATCQGRWKAGEGSRAAIVRLADPVPTAGGVVDADVVPGTCAGELKLRWPEGTPARGGTTWVVAGRWAGAAGRGTLVVRRARQLDPIPRGRGAVRDGLARRTAALFGTRAPLVLSAVAGIRQRVVAPAGTLSVAALIVLLIDPWAMRAVGAWLSIAAMGAVIWADRVFRGRALWLRLAAPSIAATLLTAPISALAFETVAPIGVVANLVAIPLAAVVVPGLALALALSWIASGVATLVAAGSGLGLALLDLVARGAAAVPGGHVVMMAGWPAAATWAGVAALAWWLWHSPRRPWLIAARIAFASTVL